MTASGRSIVRGPLLASGSRRRCRNVHIICTKRRKTAVALSQSIVDNDRRTAMEIAMIHGAPHKAFKGRIRPLRPQLGTEELLALAERYGLKPETLARLRSSLTDEDLIAEGVFLGRFGHPRMEETAGARLEEAARRKFGVPFARGTSSGTGALHAAFVAVGVGPGTEVICPALGFAATAMAVTLAGGVPVFCEVDESLQMDSAAIEPLITPRTVALAPTHHWGGVCDLEPILAVARQHGLKVVEDCAQSPGGKYRGRYVGTLGTSGASASRDERTGGDR